MHSWLSKSSQWECSPRRLRPKSQPTRRCLRKGSTAVAVTHRTIDIRVDYDRFTDNLVEASRRYTSAGADNLLKNPDLATSNYKSMEGEQGLILFGTIQHGNLMNLGGSPRKGKRYYIGNPLVAYQMMSKDFRAGLYAPLSVLIPSRRPEMFGSNMTSLQRWWASSATPTSTWWERGWTRSWRVCLTSQRRSQRNSLIAILLPRRWRKSKQPLEVPAHGCLGRMDSIASLDDEAGLRPVLRCIEKSVSRGPERMCPQRRNLGKKRPVKERDMMRALSNSQHCHWLPPVRMRILFRSEAIQPIRIWLRRCPPACSPGK